MEAATASAVKSSTAASVGAASTRTSAALGKRGDCCAHKQNCYCEINF
jgi:hypothetical protein